MAQSWNYRNRYDVSSILFVARSSVNDPLGNRVDSECIIIAFDLIPICQSEASSPH